MQVQFSSQKITTSPVCERDGKGKEKLKSLLVKS
jgi:hypothetical protein